eukprot:9311182-Alexandrium_andersonii.AAC.1
MRDLIRGLRPIPWSVDTDTHAACLASDLRAIAEAVAPLTVRPRADWITPGTWALVEALHAARRT